MSEQTYLVAKAKRENDRAYRASQGAVLAGAAGYTAAEAGQMAADYRGDKIIGRAVARRSRYAQNLDRVLDRESDIVRRRLYVQTGLATTQGELKAAERTWDRAHVAPRDRPYIARQGRVDHLDRSIEAMNTKARIDRAVRDGALDQKVKRMEPAHAMVRAAARDAQKFDKPLKYVRRSSLGVFGAGAVGAGALKLRERRAA